MSKFTTPLKVEFIDGTNWKLLEEFEYYIGEEDNKTEVIKVPSGFITDFASIPKLFWSIIGHPAGKYGKAAVLHDYLYRYGIGTRKKADNIFLEAMKVLKVSLWKRTIMYLTVRLFAFAVWNNAKKKLK